MTRTLCRGLVVAMALVGTLQARGGQVPTKGHGSMEMMADCQKMTAGMKAGQEKLDELLAEMNAATGQLKVDQMAILLAELVAQHKAMHGHMRCMGQVPASPASAPKQPPQATHDQRH